MLAKLMADSLSKNGASIKPIDEQEILRLADSLADTSIAVAPHPIAARP
jgi:hypothetical protein